jgi:sugar lactone lactonase YvrE
MLRRLAIVALLPVAAAAACSDDEEDALGSGGSAGEVGGAGETGTGGSSGCSGTGKGSVVVEVTGLPSGVDADVSLEGPDGSDLVTESVTLDDLGAGMVAVSAERVTDADPVVRTVYDPTVETASFCLVDQKTETVTVSYAAIPSSNKLWTTNGNGDFSLVAFASALLEESGDPAGSVTIDAPAGHDVAFDRDGNLWTVGPTTAEPHILRYRASVLGSSGEKERDRGIDIEGIPCSPSIRALAFDASGNLWVSTCGDQVVRLEPSDLEADGTVTPAVVFSNVPENGNLAFDADGNLWAVSDGAIARYDASRLESTDADGPDRLLSVTNPDDTNELGVTDLVFDAEGDLWITDFGGNLVFEVSAADLAGTAEETVAAAHRITIGVSALIDRPAFDESGGLWIGLGGGGVGRLSPEQLTVDTTAGDPTDPEVVITSADLGSVGRIGFFPAAADLPLFHALP